jgi:hypothetical protein
MSDPVALMSKRGVEQIEKLIRKVNNIRGEGCRVVHCNDNIVIMVPQQAQVRQTRPGEADTVVISGKVTSNAAGNGKYNGKSFTDVTADVSASGNLAESDFGTLSSTEDCLILNPVELGSSTTGHDVTATANTDKFAIYFTGRLVRTNSDGIKVVHAMLFYVGCAEA